jgi:penicillin-binding protein 2
MLVIDELKKNDPQLRLVAILLIVGFFILLVGLWWVQVVSAGEYQTHLNTQAYRTIRIPAVRGKILDREGRVLAENRPRYNLSLYLGDLQKPFAEAIHSLTQRALAAQKAAIAEEEKKLGRSLSKAERKRFAFNTEYLESLHAQARREVAAGVVAQISRNMGESLPFDGAKFDRHYATELAMPFPVLENLNGEQIARFQENFTGGLGADLELQSMRYYPFGLTAAHLLGELREDDSSVAGEESFFNYRLPDYSGVTGIEGAFNAELHGRAGEESVLVNNMGYRQPQGGEFSQPVPGENVVLTLDLDLQRAAEQSLANHEGPEANAAVVVMDVRNGDVLAMASSPAFDPNDFAGGISRAKYAQIQALSAEKNRATQENYAPGSIFKVFVGLAALEHGLDPNRLYTVDPDPENPGHGCIYVGNLKKRDLAEPGLYDFKRAIEKSSNSYFIQVGLHVAGPDRIIALGEKFHFGEGEKLPTRQESRGNFPNSDRIHHEWGDGDTANICIGQGEVAVTPLQMAVAYSAIANGGTVYWPRLVARVEPQDPAAGQSAVNYPAGNVRDHLGVSTRSLNILRNAMLGETEEGTGKAAKVAGLQICGKTGTAQVQDSANRLTGYNYWFASFAPYQNPTYAVVVMVQIPGPLAGYGGSLCAPVAHDIYEAIMQKQNPGAPRVLAAMK